VVGLENGLGKDLGIHLVHGRRVLFNLLIILLDCETVIVGIIDKEGLIKLLLELSLARMSSHCVVLSGVGELHPVVGFNLDSSSPFVRVVKGIMYTVMICLSHSSLLHNFNILVSSETSRTSLGHVVHD
jgi:hypothetical protein